MTHLLLLPACAALCGLGYRVRGGLLENWHVPGQVSRLMWGASCTVAALAAGAVWWQALLLIPAMWLGAIMPLFNSIDLGANEGSFWGDFALLTARGVLGVIFAAGSLFGLGDALWFVLLASGAGMGACYWVARQINSPVPRFGKGKDFPELGEFLTGCTIGAGVFLAL